MMVTYFSFHSPNACVLFAGTALKKNMFFLQLLQSRTMHNFLLDQAKPIVKAFDLSKHKRAVDLGGKGV